MALSRVNVVRIAEGVFVLLKEFLDALQIPPPLVRENVIIVHTNDGDKACMFLGKL